VSAKSWGGKDQKNMEEFVKEHKKHFIHTGKKASQHFKKGGKKSSWVKGPWVKSTGGFTVLLKKEWKKINVR